MWLAQSDLQVLKGEICQPDLPQTLEADLGHLALDFWICLGRFQCQGLQYKAVLLELEITTKQQQQQIRMWFFKTWYNPSSRS